MPRAGRRSAQQEQISFRRCAPRQRRRSIRRFELTLPGQTEAFNVASLFPRATGYVAERRVDIGSRVHDGDLLLRIAAPDLDQQLEQAQAQLGQNAGGGAAGAGAGAIGAGQHEPGKRNQIPRNDAGQPGLGDQAERR